MHDQLSLARYAGGNVKPQRFVALDPSDGRIIQASTNGRTIGISGPSKRVDFITHPGRPSTTDYHSVAGQPCEVYAPGATTILIIGAGGCTAFDRLKSDSDGRGVPIATTGTTIQHYGAIALETMAEGEPCRVLVERGSERPALV